LPHWPDLASFANEELGSQDVAALHLACAVGLPGSVPLDYPTVDRRLSEAKEVVEKATERLSCHYRNDPGAFRDSYAYFRTLALVTVMQRDLGFRGTDAFNAAPNYDDAADWFLHGVLAGRLGNCATLPVLTVAIGRRLGYPLVLVRSAYHLFCRWEGQGERFNIECTGRGLETPEDDYYLSWPVSTAREQAEAAGFLKSLTPCGELGSFLVQRGAALQWHGRYREAMEAFAASARLHPENGLMLGTINRLLASWDRAVGRRLPLNRPLLEVGNPPLRYSHLPERVQSRVVYLESWEAYLNPAQPPHATTPTVWVEQGFPQRVIVSYP
jgi:regulator of sirC expression with transglutaminase-like and TPR domain